MNKKYFAFLMIAAIVLLSAYSYAHGDIDDGHYPPGVIKLLQYQNQLALSINFLIAFIAGLISITSPCGFAILPTYFAVAFKDRKKAMVMAAAFSVGMLAAFAIFGVVAGFVGDFLNEYKIEFATISGYLLVLFGIMVLLNSGFSIFNFKMDNSSRKGFFGIAILGFLFGTAWTPCVGPILIGILVLAANTQSVLMGTLSLIFYGLGVVVPLLLLAYFSDKHDWAGKKFFRGKIFAFDFFGKRIEIHSYNLIGGVLLITLGILVVLYKGTFFFQTTMVEYIPWTMNFWGYVNERMLESRLLTSGIGNIFGLVIGVLLIFFVVRFIKRNQKANL